MSAEQNSAGHVDRLPSQQEVAEKRLALMKKLDSQDSELGNNLLARWPKDNGRTVYFFRAVVPDDANRAYGIDEERGLLVAHGEVARDLASGPSIRERLEKKEEIEDARSFEEVLDEGRIKDEHSAVSVITEDGFYNNWKKAYEGNIEHAKFALERQIAAESGLVSEALDFVSQADLSTPSQWTQRDAELKQRTSQ